MDEGAQRGPVLVAGAGGIGTATAVRLVSDGYDVTLADIDRVRVEAAAAECGGRAVAVDLTGEQAVIDTLDAVSQGHPLAGVVVATGMSPKREGARIPATEITLAEWEELMAVNLTSVFLLMREGAARLREGGSLVVLSSVAAKVGAAGPDRGVPPFSPSGAHYAASKAAVSSLIQSFARELAPRGIRVNGVAPGAIGGGMGRNMSDESARFVLSQIPFGRFGEPREIGDVIGFLMSAQASYITGEIIDVNGGWLVD